MSLAYKVLDVYKRQGLRWTDVASGEDSGGLERSFIEAQIGA